MTEMLSTRQVRNRQALPPETRRANDVAAARRLAPVGSVRLGRSIVWVTTVSCATASALASCSSEGEPRGVQTVDSGAEASLTTDAADVDAHDAAASSRDAGSFDGGPLPIVCASTSCATALVTTSRTSSAEGFCALLRDGTVACWGANDSGQLGRADDAGAANSVTAARVAGLTDIVQLAHTCALDESGGVWCWGRGPYLQDEAGASTIERAPVKLPLPPATSLSIGGGDLGCVVAGGSVLCWGSNARAQIAPLESAPSDAILPPTEIAVPPGAPIRRIAVANATFALREDGTTLSWGASPPLGRVSSLAPDAFPKPIALDGISSLDAVHEAACATVGGVGYCWGGRADSEPLLDRALPRPVVTPEPIVQIATTPTIGLWRWCAVGASGDVYCWGANSSGQAGDGTKDYAYDAARVKGLPAPAAEVRTTLTSTCSLLTNGKVHCWGSNYYGQLGSGMFKASSPVPQEVVLP